MTSILTNVGAVSALQVLRSISSQMAQTQGQVSSGLRVGTAADNAAYWSIATTMRSDNMALSAVQDALGLGAAKVDTAYAGMTAVVDVLKEFKAKLVAAAEDGVDKTKIQEELEQLKQQVVAISEAASFSGENWLNTSVQDLSAPSQGTASVVSSFVRASGGSVGVKKIDVELSKLSLFNSTGGGLLDTVSLTRSVGDLGGMLVDGYWSDDVSEVGTRGQAYFQLNGAVETLSPTDEITFDLVLDRSIYSPGQTHNIVIDRAKVEAALGVAGGAINSAQDWVTVLNHALAPLGGTVSAFAIPGNPLGVYYFQSEDNSGEPGSYVEIINVTSSLPGGNAFNLENGPWFERGNTAAQVSFAFSQQFSLLDGENVDFNLMIGSSGYLPKSITKNVIDMALGVTDGTVRSAQDLATLLQHVAGPQAIITASGGQISISVNDAVDQQLGSKSWILFNGLQTNLVTTEKGFLSIDIAGTAAELASDLSYVEGLLAAATDGASILGALQSRIDMQSEFVSKLTDSIDTGIGRLVDADMNEASTRLKALQTQEQLAIQSLSIANANAENVLTLFR
nr:flagellin [Rhizobium sp. Khangiran2]